jgi:uncharacterized coiled-coil protein SlyX
MAKDTEEKKVVEVPVELLTKMQEDMASLERKVADQEAKSAGLEEMVAESAKTNDKLKEKKSFEPKFRTVRLRKYPIAGDETNMGYIIGWTKKGAYQEPVQTPMGAQLVDFIDVIFYGQEKKAEKIKLLDLLNKGEQVHCKILETKRDEIKHETGEEIDVSVFDPQHGLISTGDKVDGYHTTSDIQYKLNIPGIGEIWVDSLYTNA